MSDASAAQGEFLPQKGRGPKPRHFEGDNGHGRGNGAGRGGKHKGEGFARKPREPRAEGAPAGRHEGGRPARGYSNGERKPKHQGERKQSPKVPRDSAPVAEDPKLAILKASTYGQVAEPVLVETLREAKGDVDEAIRLLNAKRVGTWSSVVSKTQSKPFVRIDPPGVSAQDSAAPAAGAKPQNGKTAPKDAAKEKTPPPAPVDPEKHIEALSKQIDETVRETESRAQQLKNIQLEIQSISGPRDSKIEQLMQDKQNLLARQQTIREELVMIESKVKEIDQEVDQIRRDKIEKIAVLEQKSTALLAEMKRK